LIQATKGECTTSEPEWWKATARYKWKAWKNLGNMPSIDAKAAYIKLAIEILSSYQKLTDIEIQSQIRSLPMSERERQGQILDAITNNVEKL
jgi:hypothetical protein